MMSHIARDNEQEFAILYRHSSGQDASHIDYGLRVLEIQSLPDQEKKELLHAAVKMTERIAYLTTN